MLLILALALLPAGLTYGQDEFVRETPVSPTEPVPAIPGVGFHARLQLRSQVVSPYREPENRFSAALHPLTYEVLSPRLLHSPQALDRGKFENQSFALESSLSRGVTMVPVSVEGPQYQAARSAALSRREWQGFGLNTLRDAQQTGRREGLSIGFKELPKRFERMFGEGGANLRVSGYRRITFSGRSQWDDAAKSGIRNQSKFPSLNMEQVSRFTIQGTIGSKISVSVSQDNQTDIPLANRLILRYAGDEDDVLRTIEAGNTNLSIPNTRFVGYSQRIQGLFGLKAEAQLGNLSFTAIASQEKGSSENAVVSATGEENAEYIRDYAYVEGRIFDLAYPGEIGPHDRVDVWIYEEEVRQDNPEAEEVVLKASDKPADATWTEWPVRMKEVPTDQYELLYGQDTTYCPVAVVFYSSRLRAVGIKLDILRYDESDNPTFDTTHIGYVGPGTDTLRILYPPNDWNPNHPAWQLTWRNCYRIPKNIAIEDIDIKVVKGLKGRETATNNRDYQIFDNVSQDPYIQILGLDQWNNNVTNLQVPDGKLDNRSEVFREEWGLVIFPEREPFNSGRAFESVNSQGQTEKSDTLVEKLPEIYTYFSETEQIESSKYFLQLSTKTRSSTIRLGRANVIEGSERVTLNGSPLAKGTDYNIMYEMGQVTLLTPEALDPNADVKVEFQYAPFMTLQKKTLLGMRAEYEYSKDLKLGTTVLYKSDKAQERKPRVGQETAKAMVMDVDATFTVHPQFLTDVVDALPLVSTEAASLFKISGEVAQSRPNPNVNGEAFVDDFESAVELLSLSIVRTRWTLSSQPLQLEDGNTWERGTLRWHNPPAVNRQDVYVGETVAGEGSLNPLRLIFRPHGYSYYGPTEDPCGDSIMARSWGGMMRSFGGIDEQRVQVFEMRAKGGTGTLHFDFGKVSEDINGDGYPQDEDTTTNKNGLDYDPDKGINEDTGLDGVLDPSEVGPCSGVWDANLNPDPAHDNWWYEGYGKGGTSDNSRPPIPANLWNDPGYRSRVNDANDWLHYEWQNGTEGNVDDQAVQGIADKEALRSGSQETFDQDNVYFSFELPLSTDISNPFLVPNSGLNGWYTYRVPVRDPGIIDTISESADRTPNWSSIDQVRVWFEQDAPGVDSLENMDSIWIADWGFVQSSWHDTLVPATVADVQSSFFVASVSEQDGTFSPPPGVEAYVDKVNNVTEVQRGLALVMEDFGPGAEGIAQKDLLTTESYSGYRRMEMYVHGDTSFSRDDSLMFFLRLGLDSANYYEYRTLIDSGWVESNYVNIDFNEITALKDQAERALTGKNQPLEDSTDVYRVVGRPNINEVRFLAASVKNMSGRRINGRKEVWIDELRVTDVRQDVGTAARVDVSGSLADLFSYQVSYEYRDAFFRGLSEATRGGSSNNLGSGEETRNLTATGTVRLNLFLPRSWQASLPVSATYSESQTIPLLRSNSDVVLPQEVRDEEKSVSKTVKFSVSEGFNKRGSDPLFNYFLNRQKVSFSYNRQRRRTVTAPMVFAENYNVRAEMNTGVAQPPVLSVFGWTGSVPILKKARESKLGLFPNQWLWTANYSRSLQFKDDLDSNRTSSFSRTFDGRMSVGYKLFPTLDADYSFTTKRDLTDDELINLSFRNPKLGLENSYNQSFQANYDPKLLEFFTGAFNYTANYNDTWDRSSESHTTSLTRSWGVNGEFRHTTLLDKLSKKKSTARRPARGTVRAGVRDEREVGKKEEGTPIYQPLVDGLRFMTGWLNPLRYKYAESFNRSIPGVRSKLPMKYRLGLDINGDFPLVESNRNPSAGETINLDLTSGFSVLGGISASVAYKVGTSRSLFAVGTDLTETVTTSWPELSISIRRFQTLPLLKPYVNWFIDVFSPKTSYSRQTKETENLDRGFIVNWSETINQSPLINLNLKLWQRLSLSGSYNLTTTKEERFDKVSGELDVETRSSKKSISVTTKYSFTAPTGIKIPLFGRLKFKSVVNTDVTVQYTSELVESASEGSGFAPFRNNTSFAVSPVVSYSFSTQIKGGITARWQDTNDQQNRRKSHVREVRLWTEIRF